jgi:hypothetical protein
MREVLVHQMMRPVFEDLQRKKERYGKDLKVSFLILKDLMPPQLD